jgi:transcriptional regulator with XRE-family HTH domain
VPPPRRPPELAAVSAGSIRDWSVALAVVVRRWRHGNDVTAQQLADRIGVDLRQVQRFEGHEGNPTLDTLIRLAGAMRVRPSTLLAALEDEVARRDGREPAHESRSRQDDVEARAALAAPRAPYEGAAPGDGDGDGRAVASIARSIRQRRNAREWSQHELADRAGLSRSKVQSIETQRHAATLDTLDALADALDCGIVELLDDDRSRKG